MIPLISKLNPIALKLGPLEIHWYGVIIACGMLLAVILSVQEGKRHGIPEDSFYDLLLWGLPVGLICARAYYVIFQWSYYSQHLDQVYRIWDGGIAIYGGLIGAFITLLVLARRDHYSPWLMLDIVAPTVILAQGIGRWGNFMNQEAHGRPTTLHFLHQLHLPEFIINQMKINGIYYQPTFLYELVWDILGFIVLVILRRQKHVFKEGEVFLSYLIWYSFGRFFIEGMRTDSLMLGSLRVSQWLSLVLFITAWVVLIWRRHYRANNPWYIEAGLVKSKN